MLGDTRAAVLAILGRHTSIHLPRDETIVGLSNRRLAVKKFWEIVVPAVDILTTNSARLIRAFYLAFKILNWKFQMESRFII